MASTFCPATMCPLFAKDGSPWTGDKNHHCEGMACGWFDIEDGCQGARAAYGQVHDIAYGRGLLQLGPVAARRATREAPRTYDCPRAHECQWQLESDNHLCPPRHALSLGLDPRTCAY